MRRIVVALALFIAFIHTGNAEMRFRLWFNTKAGTPFALDNPDAFLSGKAIERRARQHIPIDSTDLPVNPDFLNRLRACGAKPIVSSRWLNTVVVEVADSTLYPQLEALPFVKKIECVWQGQEMPEVVNSLDAGIEFEKNRYQPYGDGWQQISVHQGDRLHKAGYKGQGMTIAVLDAGFCGIDTHPAIAANQILGTRDFVRPGSNVYQAHDHGAMVLSVIAAQKKGFYIGSAPEADFWLIRTEDAQSEFPIEEDYWAAGVEFADSVGVDIVTSSLGYTQFEIPTEGHAYTQLDGRTAFISKAAQFGSEKGMIMVNSAGNEGVSSWWRIIFPADATGVLTVGAVDRSLQPSGFTGWGYTADGRIKPDVTAIGAPASFIAADGRVSRAEGTSFSAPLMAGLVACLWQSLPHCSANEIVDMVRKSGRNYHNPDRLRGYGLPDVYRVYKENRLKK